MFFFGAGRRGAHIMTAFSRDLYHWTVDCEPLYKSGGDPSGIAVPFKDFSKSLYCAFCDSRVVRWTLDKHRGFESLRDGST